VNSESLAPGFIRNQISKSEMLVFIHSGISTNHKLLKRNRFTPISVRVRSAFPLETKKARLSELYFRVVAKRG